MDSANASSVTCVSPVNDGSTAAQNGEDVKRFEVELEFLQCLANPFYLNHLAQHGYFDKKEFVNYLKYLLYWKRPEYTVFIKYPASLYLLDLLQEESFRRELVSPLCAKFVEEQLLLHWQYYAFRRRMATPSIPSPGDAASGQAAPPEDGNNSSNTLQPGDQVVTNGVVASSAAPLPNGV